MRRLMWDNVKCFLITARAGSLTLAANQLKLSPATLSRRLSNLELELGRMLFSRTPTGYVLTQEGEMFLKACGSIETAFAGLDAAFKEDGKEPSGHVRIAVSENIANFVLLPALDVFVKKYPLIELEFLTGVMTLPLHSREADLALRVSMPKKGAFKVRKVGTLCHALYLSATVDNNGLSGDLGIIGWSEEFMETPIARAATTHERWRSPSLKFSSLQGQVEAARRGFGYAYLPCLVGDRYDDLVRIAGPEGYLRQDIHLIMHDDNIETPRFRTVSDFLIETMAQAEPLLNGTY